MSHALIVDAQGNPVSAPRAELSAEDVLLLRQYKKFLLRQGLRETLYCNACFEGNLSDGCEAHVTPHDVLIRCRCKVRWSRGSTF